MKKILALSLSAMPLAAFAQYQKDSASPFLPLLIYLIFIIAIFLICREIVCWYWKINQSIKNQERIIELLEKINKNLQKEE